jgi:hypothetical protein
LVAGRYTVMVVDGEACLTVVLWVCSVADALLHIDMAFQYGEDNEVRIKDFDPEDEEDDDE